MANEIIKVLIENGLEVVIAIISIVVSCYVIPSIKDVLIPFLREKRLLNIIKKMVEGVEKMAESGIIEKGLKKEKVLEILTSKGIKVTDEIDVLIESAVKELDLISNTFVEEIKESQLNDTSDKQN